jgi:hypothetical protein
MRQKILISLTGSQRHLQGDKVLGLGGLVDQVQRVDATYDGVLAQVDDVIWDSLVQLGSGGLVQVVWKRSSRQCGRGTGRYLLWL